MGTVVAEKTVKQRTNKQLALDLLRADTEDEVIQILTDEGYWDDLDAWRLYGDKEGNYAQVGGQQSRPEAALVEKIINSVDARLMGECLAVGVNPESPVAPCSVRDAVARYYERRDSKDDEAGVIFNWPGAKRTEHARQITIAATGARPKQRTARDMCLTVADTGEGQSPNRMPDTILSLNKRNKQRVRFVQGKFNMGGSGALRFCGSQGLQLVISKRDRRVAASERGKDPSVDEWGVTVVRREAPSNKGGEPVHSEFTYLAPLGSDTNPREGAILRFQSKSLPLMPDGDEPYVRGLESGTAVKLYEYRLNVTRSNILRRGGLLYALERRMPEIALPVRLHECREFPGKKKSSFETTLAGLVVRLEDGKGDNLEEGFPRTVSMGVAGAEMTARIYAFKEDRAATYLKDEGVIFTINGQAHGHIPKSIFTRPKAVGLPKLKDCVLVLLNCSGLSVTDREDLFMTSRDRLSNNAIRYNIEKAVQAMLKVNDPLKQLQNRLREEDARSRLSDDQPLEDVLGKLFKTSPTLRSLFLRGTRLAKPFHKNGKLGGGKDDGSNEGKKAFKGRRHPTYFRISRLDEGETYRRNAELGRRSRIVFETDVENGYFERATDRGRLELEVVDGAEDEYDLSYSMVLDEGRATLLILHPEKCSVDDELTLQASVVDPIRAEPFVTMIRLRLVRRQERPSGPRKPGKRKRGSGEQDGGSGGGIEMPQIIPVHEEDKNWKRMKFNAQDACQVERYDEEVDGEEVLRPVFYINDDNVALLTEAKYSRQNAELLRAKFSYANVLVGLAMLNEEKNSKKGDEALDREQDLPTVEEHIRIFTRAIAPVMLPMIDQLAGLNEDELHEITSAGED